MVFATTPTQVAATAPSPTVPRKADFPGTGLPAALSNGGAGAQAACGSERVSPAPSGASIAGGTIPAAAAASGSSAAGAGGASAPSATTGAGSSGSVGSAANVGGPGPGPAVPAPSPAPAALPPPSLPPPYPSTMQVCVYRSIYCSILFRLP